MTSRQLLVSIGFAALANFFWATNAIVGKIAVTTLPAFTLSQFRWWLAFLLISPFGIPHIRRQWCWYRTHFRTLLILAALSVTLYNTLQYWALKYTQPVNVGAMAALMPVMIFMLSAWMGQGRLSIAQWLTATLAVMGAYTVLTDGKWAISIGGSSLLGDGIFFIGLISWSFYSVMLKKLPVREVNSVGMMTFLIGIGSLMIIPFWLSGALRGEALVPSVELMWTVAYVAVFPSLVAFFSWIKAVGAGNANIAGLMMMTAPLFNALLTLVVLRQPVSLAQWLGIIGVIVGVALTLLLTKMRDKAKGGSV
jgi:drug/metabolite transporter (DMT)-like permease